MYMFRGEYAQVWGAENAQGDVDVETRGGEGLTNEIMIEKPRKARAERRSDNNKQDEIQPAH